MTTQSFGFDLLDRMLGSRGVGCDTACCETPACCPVEPACGCETPVCCPAEPACGCEPVCGPVAAPLCGAEVACCDSPCGPKRGGLLSRLFSHCKSKGCDTACCEAPCAEPVCGFEVAAPACGCETACCDSACGPKRGGLLSRLFRHGKSSNCCDLGCDSGHIYGVPGEVPYSSPAIQSVPEAPAPIVDPSASTQSKRRVVQASARYVR